MISALLGTNHSVTMGIIEDHGHRLAGFQRRKIAGVNLISGPVPTYIPHRSLTVRKQYRWLERISCQTSLLTA